MDLLQTGEAITSVAEAFYRQPLNWAGKSLTAEREAILELDEENDDDTKIALSSNEITYSGDFDGLIELGSSVYDQVQTALVNLYLYDLSNDKVIVAHEITRSSTASHNQNSIVRHSFSGSGLFALLAVPTANAVITYDTSSANEVYDAGVAVSAITQADPGVVTANSHGRSNGDVVYLSGVSGMTEVNDKRYIVAGATTNTFELNDKDGGNIDTSGFTAYTSGGIVNSFPRLKPWSVTFLNTL